MIGAFVAGFACGLCGLIVLAIVIGEHKPRRSAHEAWGAPGTRRSVSDLSDESQRRILEAIRADVDALTVDDLWPRPLGASRGSRSRVSVDREGDVTRMTLSDFGRFAGEAET